MTASVAQHPAATPEQVAAMKAKLTEFNFIPLVDVSGSMDEPVRIGSSVTRWHYMQEVLEQLVGEIAPLDDDGMDLITFGGRNIIVHNNVDSKNIKGILAGTVVGGSTPLAEALEAALKLAHTSSKRVIIPVFTDGEPNNKPEVERVIVNQANSQAADADCTILFIQVGDNPDATAYLQYLDDGLTGKAKFDIVDVKTVEEVNQFKTVFELLINAIND